MGRNKYIRLIVCSQKGKLMIKLKIVTFICICFLIGCATTGITFVPKTMNIGIFNFKKYSENNFLFTPHNYLGDYESIGLVSIIISPSAKITKIKSPHKNGDGSPYYKKVWNVDDMNVDEALDSLFYLANKLGANAIVDLQIKEITQSYNMNSIFPQITIYGYKIDGFAIKRLGAFKQNVEVNQDISDTITIEE